VEIVVARYRAAEGRGDAVAAALARHRAESRAERGCLQFDANRSTEDPDVFLLYERYVDEAAFDEHRRTAHFRRNIEETVAPLLAERAWQRYLSVEAE
jgi:autoinducer 2-degrading protein